MVRFQIFLITTLGVVGGIAWAGDIVTPHGELTVYTANCAHGAWLGTRCTGDLAAAERFRFRALVDRQEVVFWTVGSSEEPETFADCVVENGRNWHCKANAAAQRTITLRVARGRPLRDPGWPTRGFHSVTKWQWWLLRIGLPIGNEASD